MDLLENRYLSKRELAFAALIDFCVEQVIVSNKSRLIMRQTQVSMRSHFQQDKPIMRILTRNYSFHQQQKLQHTTHLLCSSEREICHTCPKNGGGNADDFLDSISPSLDIQGGHMVCYTHDSLRITSKTQWVKIGLQTSAS